MTLTAVRGGTVAALVLLLLGQGLLAVSPAGVAAASSPTDQPALQTERPGGAPSITVEGGPGRLPVDTTPEDLALIEVSSTVARTIGTLAEHVGWKSPVAVAAYSRYDQSDPLDNDNRQAIHADVTSSPGTYVAEIAARLDLTTSTVRYHVRILEEEGLLRTKRVLGKRRVLPSETGDVGLAAALNDEATAAVLEAVYRRGATDGAELAAALDRAPSTVSHHLRRLESTGLVDRYRDGQTVIVSLPSGVIESMTDQI